jgi:uncharacterized protein YxeA
MYTFVKNKTNMKRILLFIIGLIIILLVVAAFLPKKFFTERSVVIDRPINEVYNYVKFVRNQDNYGKWNLSDPEMNKKESGTDGTVGYTYSWDGKKVGKGSQTITKLVENEALYTELNFGFGEPAVSHMLLESVGPGSTKVTWGISGNSPWPMNLMGLFYDIGKDFGEGLDNLKKVLEGKS